MSCKDNTQLPTTLIRAKLHTCQGCFLPEAMTLFTVIVLIVLSTVSASAAGIPFCALGLRACGDNGCYSELLHSCTDGKCQSRLQGLMLELGVQGGQPQPSPCPFPFSNACGKLYCDVGEACLNNKCQRVYNATSSASTTRASTNGASPVEVCTAARKKAAACSDDVSPFAVIDCNRIGTAQAPGIVCLESQEFKCAVSEAATVSSCKEGALLSNVIAGVVNFTNSLTGQLAPTAGHQQNGSQPLLQPLFQSMADAVNNFSQTVLKVNSTAAAPKTASSSLQQPSAAAPAPQARISAAASFSSSAFSLVSLFTVTFLGYCFSL